MRDAEITLDKGEAIKIHVPEVGYVHVWLERADKLLVAVNPARSLGDPDSVQIEVNGPHCHDVTIKRPSIGG